MPKIWGDTVADHKDRLRRSIIEAAVALVAERGRTEVTMSAVAERAGIGRATLYNYFGDLDEILATYVVAEFDRQHLALDERLAGVTDPLEQLRLSLVQVISYFASPEHRAGSPIGLDAFAPEAQAAVDAAALRFHSRLALLIRESIDEGLLRADLDPDFAADALNQLLAAGRRGAMRNEQPPEVTADAIYRLFVDGAGTARGRRKRR
jgi:AcrR family transcriptional regulator